MCTQDSAQLGSVVTEWSWRTLRPVLKPPYLPVLVGPIELLGHMRYAILVDAMFCKNWWRVWDRKCRGYGTRECRSPTDCTDTSQWRCHNCSRGETHATGTIPDGGPRRTSWHSVAFITLLTERTSLSRRTCSTDAIFRMVALSWHCGWTHITFCGQCACATSTVATARHGTTLVLSANTLCSQLQRQIS
jgi:hypothetical protein